MSRNHSPPPKDHSNETEGGDQQRSRCIANSKVAHGRRFQGYEDDGVYYSSFDFIGIPYEVKKEKLEYRQSYQERSVNVPNTCE
jgi:hypothetical protein